MNNFKLERSPSVDWANYARVYDLILEYNQAYHGILEVFGSTVSKWPMSAGIQVLDVGAGTGNFGLDIAARYPDAKVVLLDRDPGMLEVAKQKATTRGYVNVEFVQTDVEHLASALSGRKFDAVVAVHSLYTLAQPQAIRAIRQVMTPGACGFFCDLGRVLQIGDWASWLFMTIRRRYGLAVALRIFWQGRDVAQENRRIRKLQLDGTYWTHTLESFVSTLSENGFEIVSSMTAFRDYSDLAEVRAK